MYVCIQSSEKKQKKPCLFEEKNLCHSNEGVLSFKVHLIMSFIERFSNLNCKTESSHLMLFIICSHKLIWPWQWICPHIMLLYFVALWKPTKSIKWCLLTVIYTVYIFLFFFSSTGDCFSGGKPCVRVMEETPSSCLHGVFLLQSDQRWWSPRRGQTRAPTGWTLHIQVRCCCKQPQSAGHVAFSRSHALVLFSIWMLKRHLHFCFFFFISLPLPF